MNMKKYVNPFLLVLVYGAFAYILWPFAQVLVFALLFSFALNPLLVKMRRFKKVRLSDVQSITILVAGLFGILLFPLTIVVAKVSSLVSNMNADQIGDAPLVQKVQQITTTILESVNVWAQNFGFDLTTQVDIKTHAAEIGKALLTFATAFIANIPDGLLQFSIFVALIYYFLLNQGSLKASVIKMDLLSEVQVRRITQLFEKVCNMVLVSTVVIAFFQATLVAIGALIVGYESIWIIFTIAFFLSFTPVLGSAPITIALIGYALINGNYGHAVVLLIVALLVGTLDNLIKTYIFSSEKESVSPLIALLAIIGSLVMFGPLGLFLGPVISELAVQIGKIVEEE